MKLDESQTKLVATWVSEGATLSEIQTRLSEQFGISMTYMDVRFLLDDLNLELRDSSPSELGVSPENAAPENPPADAPQSVPESSSKVSVSVDPVQRPGVLVSGSVKFSDGAQGNWLVDSSGRLGLENLPEGYRVPPQDASEFQIALRHELSKLGYR